MMKRPVPQTLAAASVAAVLSLFLVSAQPMKAQTPPASGTPGFYSGSVPAAVLLRVPVSGVIPGDVQTAPDIKNPLANDPDAVERGMRDFNAFNCSGCHMANGGGGMGPSLSNDKWTYRASAANIYLDIVQGRAKGMPAWGAMLPDKTVWELVAYIQSISHPPTGKFGATTSASPPSPNIEQVPAEKMQSPTPWQFTEPISDGQKP